MSAGIDAMYLAVTVHVKLSAQAARPDPELRLLVGYSNLLGLLMLELRDKDGWNQEAAFQSIPNCQRGGSNEISSKFVENFEEYLQGGTPDYESSWDSDDDFESSSDSSDDSEADDLNVETADAVSRPRIRGAEGDGIELSLLEDHLAHLQFLESQVGAGNRSPGLGHNSNDEPIHQSTPQTVLVSSEKEMTDICFSEGSHLPRICLPRRNPKRLADPSGLAPTRASLASFLEDGAGDLNG